MSLLPASTLASVLSVLHPSLDPFQARVFFLETAGFVLTWAMYILQPQAFLQGTPWCCPPPHFLVDGLPSVSSTLAHLHTVPQPRCNTAAKSHVWPQCNLR